MKKRMRVLVCLFLMLIMTAPLMSNAQKKDTDQKLEKSLQQILDEFNGTAGVYVYHLKTGQVAAINADTIFPTASIVKVPILVGLFDKLEQGELHFRQPMIYRDSMASTGSGLMQYFKDSVKTDLSVMTALMMSYSDNTTSLWNQRLAGGGEAINKLMEKYGLKHTRVNSRTPGREAIRKIYGWGQTTPREMASLLVKIRNGEVVSKAASERMYRLMSHCYYDADALAQIPPYVAAVSKGGQVNESRSELVMVNAPHGDYVFYVGTKNNKDQSWVYSNEAQGMIRKIAGLLWNYFEPDSGWSPAAGIEKYEETGEK